MDTALVHSGGDRSISLRGNFYTPITCKITSFSRRGDSCCCDGWPDSPAQSSTFRKAELVRYIIEQGADACAATSDEEASLHSTCSLSSPSKQPQAVSIVQMFIDQGADLKAEDNTGATLKFLTLARFFIAL